MVVSVDAYDLIDVTQKRTASIYFKDAAEHDVLKVLTITQTPLHTSISTENISVEFDQNRNSKVFSLGNMLGRYSVSSDAPWLNIEKNKEYGNVDVTVSVETNENDDERTSKAYVFLDDTNVILYSFSVRQKGSCIEIQPTNLSCVADGGVYSIDVSTNDRWTASTQQEWITLHENGKSCSIAVSENNSLQTRSGVVQFNRLNANNEIVGKTVSLSILQEARHISPDIQTIQFGPEAAQKTLSINSDATWKLSSNESWISLSSDAGNGNADVCVSVTENTSSSSRTGSLYLKCLDKTIEILVVQNTAYLNTNTNSIRFDAKGGEANVGISTNVNWTANTNENWLSISPKNGNGDADIILKADKNYTSSQKKGIISINSLLGEYCINVSQSAPALEVSKSNVSFDYKGGSEVIIISTDYEYNVKNSSSWIVVEQNNNSLTITAKENKTWQSRSASVVIQLVGIEGVVTRTINILQKFDETSFVDLGLPSGTKWCTRNYGASNSDEFGKECTWSNNNNMGILPTRDQVNELITKCTWQWEYIKFDQYSTKVVPTVICVVTGPNGRSIRIPMVPWIGYQSQCWYWIGESINDDIMGKCGYCFTTGRYTNDIFIISKEIQYSQNSYIRFVTK